MVKVFKFLIFKTPIVPWTAVAAIGDVKPKVDQYDLSLRQHVGKEFGYHVACGHAFRLALFDGVVKIV